jgi:hypothetical protein
LPDDGGLALKIKMHPKLPALKMEYDRHRLTRDGINAKNKIAKMHFNILELNAVKRIVKLSQERVSLVECLREIDEQIKERCKPSNSNCFF